MISRRQALMFGPLGIAVAGGAAFYAMLDGLRDGSFDPRGLPSVLIGKQLPDFALPPQAPATAGFSSAELTAAPGAKLLNFFASWCVPCIEEHPALMALHAGGLPIWGIAYKDKPDAAAAFLRRNGDPFSRLAADLPGRVAIDFGVYGVPETYFVDPAGIVRWRFAGAITADTIKTQIQPLLKHYT
jgi:cytochrome c biogenesis protein CcmG/thiol:disulfide interchange protein DsbE